MPVTALRGLPARGLAALGVAALLGLWPTAPLGARDVGKPDPRALLVAARSEGVADRRIEEVTLRVSDRSGRSRTWTLEGRALKGPTGMRRVWRVEGPASDRGVRLGLLEPQPEGGVQDAWLSLPHLEAPLSLAGAARATNVLGSDLTLGDLTARPLDAYGLRLVGADRVEGKACWVVEARANTPMEVRQTGYVRSRFWIQKDLGLLLRARHWVREGRKIKDERFENYAQIDGTWVARKRLVWVRKGDRVESTTEWTVQDVAFGREDVTEEDFAQPSR